MQKKNRSQTNEIQGSSWEKEINRQDRTEMIKKYGFWIAISIVAFLGLAGLVMLAGRSGPSNEPVVNENIPAVSTTDDIIIGNKDAKVAIIKYTDFQCPACASYGPVLDQVLNQYGDQVRIVYRFFPIDSIHKNAQISAQAAWAAWKLGKFSEMKDELYNNQVDWENIDNANEKFIVYAASIGLNEREFEKLMNSDEAKKYVDEARAEALRLGLNATPTFFIGNKQINVNRNLSDFQQYIDDELGSASSEQSSDSMESKSTEPTLPPLQ